MVVAPLDRLVVAALVGTMVSVVVAALALLVGLASAPGSTRSAK